MIKANARGSGARRSQVANACQACRASKVKCSGKHPTCARCSTRGIECSYDVSEEGMTRREYLRQEYGDQRRELDIAMNVLDVLRHGSDQQATETLARIRLGQSLAEANDEIESARASRRQEEESCAGDEHSAPDTPSTLSFDHQGPYPNLEHARPSLSSSSAIPSSSYWTREPPAPPTQTYPPSTRPPEQQQQQQFNPNPMELQGFAWPSSLSPESQSTASEWSNMGMQQFEPSVFGMDSRGQSRAPSGKGTASYPTSPMDRKDAMD